MADNSSNTQNKNAEVYEVNPRIMNSALGYSALIDGDNIMVVPNQYGEGYNSQNEKINIIKERGFILINGERASGSAFGKLSDKQLYQLVIAGVIILSPAQQAEFRKKFFNQSSINLQSKPEAEKKK
ncbi:MAG: hypothetical protein K8I03_14630 [Ignavibacteria bacterium]|nr:hypothetical protein [Ignavibacteria bacterium]